MFVFLFLFAFLNQASSQVSFIPNNVTGFSFPSFSTHSCSDGSLICTGSVASGDGYLSLTPEPKPGIHQTIPTYQVGRVLYKLPVLAWPAYITTTFTIRIIPSPPYLPGFGANSADGITFIMAPNDGPSPPRSYGSYLGLMDPSQEGTVTDQLAVEFDTYQNTYDIDGNHIAIDTKSVKSPLTSKSLSSVGVDLKSGKDIKVQIDLDSTKLQLQVYVGYASDTLVHFLDVPIDISELVPSSVYVGFTASTGALTERNQLIDWKFTSVAK